MNRKTTVAFFPSAEALSENAYWVILAEGLQNNGFELVQNTPPSFDLGWLFRNRSRIGILHLHFIQAFYKSTHPLKVIIKLLGFGINMFLAKLLGYKTIFTLHNLEATYPIEPPYLDYIGHFISANLSDRVIVYCEESKKLLKEKYWRKKNVWKVEHPALTAYYPNTITRENARLMTDVGENTFVFLFFGGIRPNKGVELLIRAFKELPDSDIRLLIAGKAFPPASYIEELRNSVSQDPRIILQLEYIPDERIQVYMNCADVVILPFAKILTSGTAHLAMSFGKPVIVPRTGCLPEMVESGAGWLFDPGDTSSLIEVMSNSRVDNPASRGKIGRDKIFQSSISNFILSHTAVYCDN